MVTRPGTMWEPKRGDLATTVLREVLGCLLGCRRIIDLIVCLDAFNNMTRHITLEHGLVKIWFALRNSAPRGSATLSAKPFWRDGEPDVTTPLRVVG